MADAGKRYPLRSKLLTSATAASSSVVSSNNVTVNNVAVNHVPSPVQPDNAMTKTTNIQIPSVPASMSLIGLSPSVISLLCRNIYGTHGGVPVTLPYVVRLGMLPTTAGTIKQVQVAAAASSSSTVTSAKRVAVPKNNTPPVVSLLHKKMNGVTVTGAIPSGISHVSLPIVANVNEVRLSADVPTSRTVYKPLTVTKDKPLPAISLLHKSANEKHGFRTAFPPCTSTDSMSSAKNVNQVRFSSVHTSLAVCKPPTVTKDKPLVTKSLSHKNVNGVTVVGSTSCSHTPYLANSMKRKSSASGIGCKDPDFNSVKEKKAKKDLSSVKSKLTKKEKAPPPEKRLKRMRTSMNACGERIGRALSQRLFLVKREDVVRDEIGAIRAGFTVLGSTGNVYNVTIGRLVQCTCPDHQKGNICKHIIFVMVRVLKQSRESTLIIQAALLSTELEQIFANVSTINDASVLAKPEVRAAFGAVPAPEENTDKRKPIADDDDCGVCFEALKESREAELDWCKDGCGKSIHKQCWNMWKKQGHNTCVYCRQEWRIAAKGSNHVKMKGKGKRMSEGYVNVGQLQGQSSQRDTSTYYDYSWNSKWNRRWKW